MSAGLLDTSRQSMIDYIEDVSGVVGDWKE